MRQTFPYPLDPCPRIALFSNAFAPARSVVPATDPDGLGRLDIRTVAAPMSVFHRLHPASLRLEYPLVILSQETGGLLTDEERDYLWCTFGLPAFEYLLDSDGALIATECEAHEGLHLLRELPAGFAEITEELCPCGRPGPRLLKLKAIIEEFDPVPMELQEWRNWQTHQT